MRIQRYPVDRNEDRFRKEGGYAVLIVLILGTIGLATLGGVLGWCTTNCRLNQRNNQYFRTVAAAEAASEKVLTRICCDYQSGGEALIANNMASYRLLVPTTSESSVWAQYQFSNGWTPGRTWVENTVPIRFTVLDSQYRGLYGWATDYRIISNAQELTGSFGITSGVEQDVQVATIPVFQFAVFYNLELEICPGADMTINGPVHCNTNIYLQPQSTLLFQDDVTCSGMIITGKDPNDPSIRTLGTITFMGEHDSGVSTMNLPIGTNNTPAAVRQVVEIPPGGEVATSTMGTQRYYNKADMIILVKDSGVTVTSGPLVDNCATSVPSNQYKLFLTTTNSFVNMREGDTVKATQIDVGKLITWNATNNLLRPIVPFGDVTIIYVDDQRSQTSSTQPGVRLVNGQTILPKGLTVATPKPLYIQGHYNAPSAALGTHNTSNALPASVVADAVTILSPNWVDSKSGNALSSRTATATTVNAAFLAGVVPTTSGSYSGGLENFPRFLESWTNIKFTYNGSMVVMYPSQFANAPWTGTGTYYNPPTRDWALDLNFTNPAKLPPGTPTTRALIRGQWALLQPNWTPWAPH